AVGIVTAGRRPARAKKAFNRLPPTEQHGACPALVDNDTFERARQLLVTMKERSSKCQSKRAGLLSGFLVCGHCGKRLSKQVWKWSKCVSYGCLAGRLLNTGCPQ